MKFRSELSKKKTNALPSKPIPKLLKPKQLKSNLKNKKQNNGLDKQKLKFAVSNSSFELKPKHTDQNVHAKESRPTKPKKSQGFEPSHQSSTIGRSERNINIEKKLKAGSSSSKKSSIDNTIKLTKKSKSIRLHNSPKPSQNASTTNSEFKNKTPLISIKKGTSSLGRPVKSSKKVLNLQSKSQKPLSLQKRKNSVSKKPSPNKRVRKNKKKSKNIPTHQLGKLENTESKLSFDKVLSAVTALLRHTRGTGDKANLLSLADPVFMQVECIKIPICPIKQLRFPLPHPLVNELSEILLITPDLKGSKVYTDKSVEHYTKLLDKNGINFIQKVMPLRMLRQEYSQYEMKRRLADQFDMILTDASVSKFLPKMLGKVALFNRKMPIAVQLDRKNLKETFENAISKTQMTIKPKGHMSIVQVGTTTMGEEEITANIIEVTKWLAQQYPGGWINIRLLNIKTGTSPALPIYLSLISPNDVKIPVEQPKKKPSVEGELSTMPGMNVVVRSDGTVSLKKVDEEILMDDSQDDEILEEAEKYMQSSKTVRYGESDDEENDEKATAAMEQELSKTWESLKSAKRAAGDEEEDDDEEEEESSDEEVEPIPKIGNKRKGETKKRQAVAQPAAKKLKTPPKTDKLKGKNKNQKSAESVLAKPRGSRGGKKNKINKDQRKAMIKRKKAGK